MGASPHWPSAKVNVSVMFLALLTVWSVSSSLTALAVQPAGVRDDRNAHQIVFAPLRFGGEALPLYVAASMSNAS
ncbi:hypothetical protein [Mycobacterium sp.]|uniref:hypothetical protein n=2 Tax=Mycobacterium sp. TaxID=1785 RepID=UPI003C46AC00